MSPPKAAVPATPEYKGRPSPEGRGDSAGTAEAEMLAVGVLMAAIALPSPMTTEFLCSAATEDSRCCFATDYSQTSICFATAADNPYYDSDDDLIQCGETINDAENGGYTYWSVRCPWPPPSRSTPAEPADLDGATVGTIVVASLIGVALVGGAIAVHSGVAGV